MSERRTKLRTTSICQNVELTEEETRQRLWLKTDEQVLFTSGKIYVHIYTHSHIHVTATLISHIYNNNTYAQRKYWHVNKRVRICDSDEC